MKKIAAVYNLAEERVLIGSLVVTSMVIFYQVVMRFVFNDSPSWSEELTRFIFVWQVWLGTSIGAGRHEHIQATILENMLIKHEKYLVKNLVCCSILLIWLSFTVAMVIYGIDFVQQAAVKHAISPVLKLPYMYVYAAVPVGCGLVSIRIMADFFTEVKKIAKGGAA